MDRTTWGLLKVFGGIVVAVWGVAFLLAAFGPVAFMGVLR